MKSCEASTTLIVSSVLKKCALPPAAPSNGPAGTTPTAARTRRFLFRRRSRVEAYAAEPALPRVAPVPAWGTTSAAEEQHARGEAEVSKSSSALKPMMARRNSWAAVDSPPMVRRSSKVAGAEEDGSARHVHFGPTSRKRRSTTGNMNQDPPQSVRLRELKREMLKQLRCEKVESDRAGTPSDEDSSVTLTQVEEWSDSQ